MSQEIEEIFVRYTSAPEAYDYWNTSTVRVVGSTKKGEDIRKVEIRSRHSLCSQEPRYTSGLHFCLDEEDFNEIRDLL